MRKVYRYESYSMLLGDLVIFGLSLWFALTLRALVMPSADMFVLHLRAFMPVFILWICLYVLGGLYDRHLRFSHAKLAGKLWLAQTLNIVLAFGYFYILRTSDVTGGITPKTILLLYLIISGIFITVWRIWIYPHVTEFKPLRVVCIGKGPDYDRLKDGRQALLKSGIDVEVVDSAEALTALSKKTDIIVSHALSEQSKEVTMQIYDLLFTGVSYIDMADFYEEIFEMIPLQAIDESWFLRYVATERRYVYDILKRIMDITIALPLYILSLPFYPFVYMARKIENLGPVFIFQNRVGEGRMLVRIIKFGSMTVDDTGKQIVKNDNRITPVGAFIRKTRIDELPQLWNVLKGELSLIGPRPELPGLVEVYKKEIPHYDIRHIIPPGLSGWAQIHHDVPPQSVEATKQKLAYDLYYIKNRGLILDLKIAFATIKTLLSRTGL
jgi:lipopolysaccharide/colanic/teichoic acid biosynthesis glycosyltransferase